MADLHKIAVTTLSVLWIMATTTLPLATAQEAALSEGGATWACGVFGKMPRRRQGMYQSLYVEISNQGRRMERCHTRLH